MATFSFRLAGPLAAIAALAAGSDAAQPSISNGRVSTQQAGAPFPDAFRTLVASRPGVVWIGYDVRAVAGDRTMCCASRGGVWNDGDVVSTGAPGCCSSCSLEPGDRRASAGTRPAPGGQPIALEPAATMHVLFRVESGRIDRIRLFSSGCHLDAGGREVVWLENVPPAGSLALLESLATSPGERPERLRDGAVSAIALHAESGADEVLDRLLAADRPVALRKKVTFWLGHARGSRGLATLGRILRDDASPEVRKSAVFGVSQSREPAAFEALAELARSHATAAIRSEAVFWIAQKDDRRAAAVILDALEKDPATEVRKKAVFALTQLPNNAGVEPLIRTARSHVDASVRGEAIFWLGQKAGARASSAITERIEQDPDTEVKKRAVFALSQLPKDEGVPLLIQVARTNSNPAVRKQAMFWLGQSRDPRALEFFAEILK